MSDTFSGHNAGLESPASRHYDAGAIASDTVALSPKPRALRFNVAGVVKLGDGTTAVSYTVVAGEVMPFRATLLYSTGTDSGLKATGATVAWY